MTRRSRAVFVALIAVVIAGAVPWHVSPAQACSCAYPPDAADLRFVDTVFSGTVVEAAPWDGRGSSATLIPVKVSVDHVWIGDVEPTTTVRTAASGASCGYTFNVGTRYLVYSQRGEASYCSPTQPYSPAAVAALEAVAGPGRPVDGPEASPTTSSSPSDKGWDTRLLVAASVLGVVALAAVIVLVRPGGMRR